MKILGQRNICAFLALVLAGTVLTSASATPANNPSEVPVLEEDLSYMEDVQAYVDAYMASLKEVEEAPKTVKVFDKQGNLVLQGVENQLSQEGQKMFRQANYLATYNGTDYYDINY